MDVGFVLCRKVFNLILQYRQSRKQKKQKFFLLFSLIYLSDIWLYSSAGKFTVQRSI